MTNDDDLSPRETPVLLTFEQVAVRLQVSHRSIERYVKQGLLSSIRLSARKRRISEADLEKFIIDMRERYST